MRFRRFHPSADPFDRERAKPIPFNHYAWPAAWIAPAQLPREWSGAFAADLSFTTAHAATIRIHVSADQLAELRLDGEFLLRAPEASTLSHWHYDSLEIDLPAGAHRFEARIFHAGPASGMGQETWRPAFLLAAEGDWSSPLSTGVAPWRVKLMPGYRWECPQQLRHFLAPGRLVADTAQWTDLRADEPGWEASPQKFPMHLAMHPDRQPGWVLHPSQLPDKAEESITALTVRHAQAGPPDAEHAVQASRSDHALGDAAARFFAGDAPWTLEAHSEAWVLVDTGTYCTAYSTWEIEGGRDARLAVEWAESLFDVPPTSQPAPSKGDRAAVDGKYFLGTGDTWSLDGRAHRLTSVWYDAGRYFRVHLRTGAQPLVLKSFRLVHRQHPLVFTDELRSADAALDRALPLCRRVLAACAYDHFMDCPYYERMMYVGDARLEALTAYAATTDTALSRKALQLFQWTQDDRGWTSSRVPTRARQVIPPFSLWWVCMLEDFAWWRGDPALVRHLLSGARRVLDVALEHLGSDGLMRPPPGWNFIDWVRGWPAGTPPVAADASPTVLSWQLVLALGAAERLEAHCGEPELAARWRRRREDLVAALETRWRPSRAAYAEDADSECCTQHSQALAILSRSCRPERAAALANTLEHDRTLAPATVYFSHYVFEALAASGRAEALVRGLDLWRGLPAQGFVTVPESPEPARSDCHAWGAHPLYHLLANLLGVRPGSWGFATVEIRPQLGGLAELSGTVTHPLGPIRVAWRQDGPTLRGKITLPAGLSGRLILPKGERTVSGSVEVLERLAFVGPKSAGLE